jgi:hypothetical protein
MALAHIEFLALSGALEAGGVDFFFLISGEVILLWHAWVEDFTVCGWSFDNFGMDGVHQLKGVVWVGKRRTPRQF